MDVQVSNIWNLIGSDPVWIHNHVKLHETIHIEFQNAAGVCQHKPWEVVIPFSLSLDAVEHHLESSRDILEAHLARHD